MFDRKTYSHFFKKAALLLCLSSMFTYGVGTLPRLEPQSATEESALGNFLIKNLHITLNNYDHALGTGDLFMMHKKNRLWGQVGFVGSDLFGAGVGYRHLVKGDYPYQDWFLGFYGYGRFKSNEIRKRYKWNAGIELATTHTQWTLNGYGIFKSSFKKGQEAVDYREGDLGASLRMSVYYFQKMQIFGRINPFFFAARTRVTDTKAVGEAGKKLGSIPMQHGGMGFRCEGPYVAAEVKWVFWNPGKAVQPLQLGIQIEFAGRRNKEVSYASHRLREMPQYYEPSHEYEYGEYSAQQKAAEDQDKDKNDEDEFSTDGGPESESEKEDTQPAAAPQSAPHSPTSPKGQGKQKQTSPTRGNKK